MNGHLPPRRQLPTRLLGQAQNCPLVDRVERGVKTNCRRRYLLTHSGHMLSHDLLAIGSVERNASEFDRLVRVVPPPRGLDRDRGSPRRRALAVDRRELPQARAVGPHDPCQGAHRGRTGAGGTPPADTWQDWVEKFGIDPDRVRGMESDDLAWLRAGEGEGHFHGPGAWPFGIDAYAGRTISSSGSRRSARSSPATGIVRAAGADMLADRLERALADGVSLLARHPKLRPSGVHSTGSAARRLASGRWLR